MKLVEIKTKINWGFWLLGKPLFVIKKYYGTAKVAKGAKAEGELVIAGTKGYIYVPASWWKTDYFEVRYENPEDNKRFYYQLDGEGIRYEIVAFAKAVESGKNISYVSEEISETIGGIHRRCGLSHLHRNPTW